MFDGTTLLVDVVTLGENSYALSLPAEDLWVAYEVVRRHVDANGVRHYSQMTEAKTTSDGYSFKFDTGDTFTCASHLDKPTSSTLSDETGGGGSGGVPYATSTIDWDTNKETLDKTWAEIMSNKIFLIVSGDDSIRVFRYIDDVYVNEVLGGATTYDVTVGEDTFSATSQSGYPSRTLE